MSNDLDDGITANDVLLAVEAFIHKKLFSESKDEVALIYCGTENNFNPLIEDSEAFKHISIISELGCVNWNTLEKFKQSKKSSIEDADLLEAIYVGADHLVSKIQGRQKFGRKRILLFSNLNCKIDVSQIDMVIEGLEKEIVEFNIISDKRLTDMDKGGELDKSCCKLSTLQISNINELLKLVKATRGNCYSIEEATSSLSVLDVKSTAQRGWKVNLQVSNIFTLSLVGYTKVKSVAPQSFKSVYGGDPDAEIEIKVFHSSKDSKDITIDPEDMIKGFKYGKSIIPCTDIDIKGMKLDEEKSMKLIGFTEKENVPQSIFIGDCSIFFVVDQESHSRAFTSLVYAMYALNVVALVRKVYSKASSPKLGVLIPRIKCDNVALVYSEIAFGEDIRSYTFPTFEDKAKLSSNRILSDKQISDIDNLIDHLLLVDQEIGKEKELYKPSTIRNPVTQYFYQCAQFRYLQPGEKLPELSEEILSTVQLSNDKIANIQDIIDSIKENFPLKTKEENSKKKPVPTCFGDSDKPSKKIKCLDETLVKEVTEIGSINPIDDFQWLLSQDQLNTAVSGMENRIWQLIIESYLDTFYQKAIDCLKEYRKQSIEYSTYDLNLVEKFNHYIENMENELNVNSPKYDFWKLVIQEKIEVIFERESKFSSVKKDQKANLKSSEMFSDDDSLVRLFSLLVKFRFVSIPLFLIHSAVLQYFINELKLFN